MFNPFPILVRLERPPSRLWARLAACSLLASGSAWGQVTPPGNAGENTALNPSLQTCAGECHQDMLTQKVMHGPVLEDCAKCHVEDNKEDHTFFLLTTPEELCIKCHSIAPKSHGHEPVLNNDCMACHDAHGSKFPSVLVADPKGDLCAQCHDPKNMDGKFVHGPVVVGACVVCHEAHTSDEPALLRKPERETCLECHGEVDRTGEEGWHTHGALEQGCTGCHDPHASDHKFQLEATAPDLCLSCHEDTLHDQLTNAKIVHGALTQEGGCTDCHEAHGSTLPMLQKGSEVEACLRCHSQELKTATGETLTDMGALLANNPNHHGPIREGQCTVCHQPHAGDRFRLLEKDYPPAFYAPFKIDTFALCFTCHIPELVLEENGRGLTNFRQGDQNLHWLHVNQEKGRTCRACHEVHASQRAAHVREAVPFGDSGWMLEINFDVNAGGGSCTPGCHKTKTYRRGDTIEPPKPRSVLGIPEGPSAGGE
ncbi:Cytochrome c family protein [hydrothermal vent metagenome]|uniref:Cytochrome c family protein n=1 Tax=hydrothermal vent metagenome TaxID=652676 RepID=A0A3B1DYR7_9ZZZZ